MIEVYCHTSPSGKKYVGLSSNGADRRWREHVKLAKGGSPQRFHRAIRKYGAANFTHEVLERMTTEAGAKRAEQLWIRELGTFGSGYNATAGGDGVPGLKHRPESIAQMREKHRARSPEWCAKISAGLKGRTGFKHSAESRAKMSVSAKNRVATPPGSVSPEKRAKAYATTKAYRDRLRAARVKAIT